MQGKSEASAVNGSMGLGITANSGHADEAWKYIAFITSQPVQNKYAKLSLPIWKTSYDDPAVTKGQESLIAAAKLSIGLMFPRPTTPPISELSAILQKNLQEVLLGQATPEQGMQTAAEGGGTAALTRSA